MISPILLGIGAAAVVLLIVLIRRHYAKKRRDALQAAAPALGMTFDAGVPPGYEGKYAHFKLFDKGHGREVYNKFEGKTRGYDVRIFDYEFSIGSGRSGRLCRQTVVAFSSPRWNFPAFQMIPEGLVQAIQELFSRADIDFAAAPEFSKQYYLTGVDRASVEALFDRAKLDFFSRVTGMYVEGNGKELIVYQHDKLAKPDAIAPALENALTIADVFSS